MTSFTPISRRTERIILAAIALLFVGLSAVGITWGLPSRSIDKYLFGDAAPWSGEKIYRLAGAAEKFSPTRGADVDVDPLAESGGEPILLTGTEENVARIYLRYRLYTYQPDEMITMMALAGMNPRELQFDPRLYQYGGLFIYPVGGLIGLCGLTGLIDVRGDFVFYLDNPDEFGRFYVVARAYAAAWGLVGMIAVFAIARRLGGSRTGLLAALLFTLMPVVICMAHEGKPHLPGAALMLLAVLFAMRHLSPRAAVRTKVHRGEPRTSVRADSSFPRAAGFSLRDHAKNVGASVHDRPHQPDPIARPRSQFDFWLMCVCCGAAFGMVLSSWPIFVLIPFVAWIEHRSRRAEVVLRCAVSRTVLGCLAGFAVYLLTNPYILINALLNRDVLASNFGNSLAMYQVTRVWEGFARVLELTVEGATWPLLVLGVMAVVVAMLKSVRRSQGMDPPSIEHESVAASLPPDAPRGLKPAAQGCSSTSGAKPDSGNGTAFDATSTASTPAVLVLVVPAAVFFLQFVLIGAGKPAEYGRFGIFPNTALAIGAAWLLTRRWIRLREIVNWVPATFIILWVALLGAAYLRSFHLDATNAGSRIKLAAVLRNACRAHAGEDPDAKRCLPPMGVLADPAPYNHPPMDFSRAELTLYGSREEARSMISPSYPHVPRLTEPVDRLTPAAPASLAIGRGMRIFDWLWQGPTASNDLRLSFRRITPISWANKPFYLAQDGTEGYFGEWGLMTRAGGSD